MDVSIIIVNLNSRQLLEDCLTSVYQHTHDIEFETIVVDNASTDGSVEMVKTQFPQVRLIENAVNNRYAIANNQGLALARGRHIFYLNGDTILLGNTVKEMVKFLDAHPQVGGVGCCLMYPDGAYQDACFRFPSALNVFYLLCLSRFYWKTSLAANYPQVQQATEPQSVDFVMGACLMARRDLLQQIHGMDEDYYFYGEDSDLCYRIWQAGWPIYYLPQSTKIIHYGGISSTINLFDNDQRRKHLRGWTSRFLFIKKHYPFWRRVVIFIAVLSALGMNTILYGLAAVKRRDWQYFQVNMDAHLAITRAACQII
ncbi:glycosyl transferase, family 2 [Candidatus Vecturithrix granuli]|uniref:Glycosyl transferase, family 2 n=1 Tax=Vecturithrix granuli TaxID=1499967 RepID=A0A0S6W6P6_VECG1|nr:glycosyl transferase, family 2 [Candidatus Vecturithrix granuli]